LKLFFENWEVHRDSNSQSGSPFGSVWVHSFKFSYNPGSMKCDFRVSFSVRTFGSPCFDREPRVKVATLSKRHSLMCLVLSICQQPLNSQNLCYSLIIAHLFWGCNVHKMSLTIVNFKDLVPIKWPMNFDLKVSGNYWVCFNLLVSCKYIGIDLIRISCDINFFIMVCCITTS